MNIDIEAPGDLTFRDWCYETNGCFVVVEGKLGCVVDVGSNTADVLFDDGSVISYSLDQRVRKPKEIKVML